MTEFSSLDDLAAQVRVGLVALARLAPVIWLVPFFGGRLVPAVAKTALIVLLGLVLYPLLAAQAAALHALPLPVFVAVVLKELFVGLSLGFLVSLVFWAAQSAGWLMDTVRGASLSEVLVQQSGAPTSPTGLFLLQLTIVLFFAIGGHRLFLTAISSSYIALPLLSFPQVSGLGDFALLASRLTGALWLLALSLAAPVIVALLLTELTLGWINRFVPQVNVYFLALPLRAVLGIAVLVLSVTLIATTLPPALSLALDHVTAGIERLQAR